MDSFWGNIFSKKDDGGGLKGLLRRIPIFASLTEREITVIERILHEREYLPGEEVFREGEPGIAMYIIQTGSVVIRLDSTKQVLAELGPGEFFGELALLDDAPRSATAAAKDASKIFAFSQPDLFGIIERNPHLGVTIVSTLAKIIGERLKHTNEQLRTLKESTRVSP